MPFPGLSRAALAVAACCSVSACASKSPPLPACTVAGNYLTTGTVQSGDCPGTSMPVADTFTVEGGMANLVFAGLNGTGFTCPLDGCSWSCTGLIKETDATDPTNDEIQVEYAYTFTPTGLTGTLTETAAPAASLPTGCTGVIAVTGTRQ